MFTFGFRDPFGCQGVSCVKLPAAVAFPTDDRLLQRIEELRRALPANNVKALWKSRELASEQEPPSPLRERDVEKQLTIRMPPNGFDAFRARPESLPLQISAIPLEAELRAQSPDPQACIVPLARAAGAHARARDGLSASAA